VPDEKETGSPASGAKNREGSQNLFEATAGSELSDGNDDRCIGRDSVSFANVGSVQMKEPAVDGRRGERGLTILDRSSGEKRLIDHE
jgi:hypothetical protein